ALTAVAALVATGCTSDEEPGPSGEARSERAGEVLAGPSVADDPLELPDDLLLASFPGCADLLEHIQARALDLVGPYGLNGGGGGWRSGTVDDGDEAAADDAGAAAPEAGLDTSEVSGTNVQEAGVDEPDLVKTDGSTLYTVTQERLRVLDIRGEDPVELASLEMRDAWDAQLLLAGD